MAALKRALTDDFKMHERSSATAKPSMCNQSSLYDITRHGTVFQRLLKRSMEKPNPYLQLIEEEYYSEATLDKVLSLYTHQDKHRYISADPCFIPFLVRSLCELKQYRALFNYLQVINARSLFITFVKTYCLASMAESEIDD